MFTNEIMTENCKNYKEKACEGCPNIILRNPDRCTRDYHYDKISQEWIKDGVEK